MQLILFTQTQQYLNCIVLKKGHNSGKLRYGKSHSNMWDQ
ncbi:hypothetical protein ACJIZ3_010173 [Penstemon smallii]|uniref:Uncharacterized protein n=1 Tax=Penstemon smallii TaxID=265156 RepID=A0ABD3TF75_9LAMI